MRGVLITACLLIPLAGIGAARAESGGLFKSLLGGGGESREAAAGAPSLGTTKLYDPNEAYCPNVAIREGAAAIRSFAGAAGDGGRLRHQITFARLSRECTRRPDGGLTVKVGVELRGLLGPAGAPGGFEAPLTVTVRASEKTLEVRGRRVRVSVPAGAAQGTAAVIEDGLSVPAANAGDYEIEVALAAAPAGKAPRVAATRGRKAAAPAEASAEGGAAGQ